MKMRIRPSLWIVNFLAVIMLLLVIYFLQYSAFVYIDGTKPMRTVSTETVAVKETAYSNDITVVTAYFYIPKFKKGSGSTHFSNRTYSQWAIVLARLTNPLIVYTDSDDFYDLMADVRKDRANSTRLIKLNSSSLWSFQRKSSITEIFRQPGYPKHHPNTVIPAYSCAQHAKVEVTRRACVDNPFHTNYFAWLDVGYFRGRMSNHHQFTLVTPKDFNASKVAMNEVYNFQRNTPIHRIFKMNLVWVGGGLILGHRDVLLVWEQQYKRAFEYFLSRKIMNTDQQLLFGMFSNEGRKVIKPEVELQLYRSSGAHSWFHLGNLMVREQHR